MFGFHYTHAINVLRASSPWIHYDLDAVAVVTGDADAGVAHTAQVEVTRVGGERGRPAALHQHLPLPALQEVRGRIIISKGSYHK